MRRTPAVLLLAVATLAGCTSDLSSAPGQNYVAGEGLVTVIDEAERRAPDPAVEGETVDGEPIALADFAGRTVVMPIWGQWCPPCRKEAPMFAAAARDLADDGVEFVGVNVRNPSRTEPQRFQQNFDLPYPSVYDPDGIELLSFHGEVTAFTIPSVVVLDEEGRIAAVVRGETSRSTLYAVVEDVTGRELV